MLNKEKMVLIGIATIVGGALVMGVVSLVLFVQLNKQLDEQAATIQTHTDNIGEIVTFLNSAVQANQGAPEPAPTK